MKNFVPFLLNKQLNDLIVGCGAANPPGIEVRCFVVEKDDIDIFPLRKVIGAPGDSVTLDGDIVLLPLKAFKIVDMVVDTGEVTTTMVGAEGSKAYESFLNGTLATTSATTREWLECNANGCLVWIVREKSGQMRVLGTKTIPATLDTVEGGTGIVAGDTRGYAISIKDHTGLTASTYEGVIDLDPLT